MLVIEGTEGRNGQFNVVLPEAIPTSNVHKSVALNIGVRHRALRSESNIRDLGKLCPKGIDTGFYIIHRHLSIEAVIPFGTDAVARGGRGSSALLKAGDRLVRMLIRVISKSA